MSATASAVSHSAVSSVVPHLDDLTLFEPALRSEAAAASDERLARRAREGVAVLRTRLSGPAWTGPAVLERVFWLDPYALEIMIDDARQAQVGTRLEVQLDPATPTAVVARVRGRLTALERRGILVDVRRARRAA